ncbi:PP2C family protein-serine/threonine phosphatase [Streptomyces sp. NBC_00838]|uniref:PP2C family protein-serine/threonine phosphatase n=1 Tax=Streptomyces sp. NBC_00838 TaxID=2903680 RepID=UPI00386FDF2C|nr:PP2C family protein-serine/threonine phosphatase [Streptomyces sp. NBC_00838]
MTVEGLLAAVEQAPPVDSVAVVAQALARQMDAREVRFWIIDFTGDVLLSLPVADDTEGEGGEQHHIDLRGTLHEQVIRSQQLHITETPEPVSGYRVLAPVTTQGDAIGILEVTTTIELSPRHSHQIAQAAQALAYVVTSNRRFTDLYEWGRRSIPPTLAAEIQHNLLPQALSCEAGPVTFAGALQPTHDISGDTFDYSLDRHTLHVSITDAVGHHTYAALLATLIVGSLRNTRRARAPLAEQARAAHQAVLDYGQDATVTGQLLNINLSTGHALFVNAGHPWPLRLRNGRVSEIQPEVDLPFGAPWDGHYRVQNLDLTPGDRLVLITDGMTERNTTALDLPARIKADAALHPREAVRSLMRALHQATEGNLLDDATVICLDWHGTSSSQHTSATSAHTSPNHH